MTLKTLLGYETRTLRQKKLCQICGADYLKYDCRVCRSLRALSEDEVLSVIKELYKYLMEKQA